MRRLALLILSLSLFAVPATASAADFIPAAGTYAVDTTTLKLTGPGTNITGVNQGGVAVFSFGTVNIASSVTINAAGSRPFKLAASGNLTMSGTINSNGASPNDREAGPMPGGAGGGAGAAPLGKGAGPGGGGAPTQTFGGGGGGGFGGSGARGGLNGGGPAGDGPRGPAYGNLNLGAIRGGSGGGGGTTSGGGGGGGGIALFGGIVTVDGVVFAQGGSGSLSGGGASGGGSGGGIVVHGDTVDVSSGALVADGGVGGMGSCCGDGGGGGGGRIAYQFRTLAASGFARAAGGQSGVRNTGGANSPGTGTSPDAFGAAGVITKQTAASATTSPATGVGSSAATLNGTVNPHGSATSFIFQFGRTTAYGTNVSGSGVGSDNVDHAVAKAVGGLAPSTTYHYRVVAIDSLGFVTAGADVGFTTAATPPPPPPPPALTTLGSTTSINSLAFPKFTKLLALSAKNLPANSKVVVTCKTKKKKQQKKGCPYKKKTFKSAKKKAKLDLRKPFKKKKVPVGTKIGITITASGFLGKRITYTTRKGKLPKSKVQCLTASGRTGRCR